MSDTVDEGASQQMPDEGIEEVSEDDAAGEELGGTGIELIHSPASTLEFTN